MSKDPINRTAYVEIVVLDQPENTFTIEIKDIEVDDQANKCIIKMNNDTYLKLLEATTTFENEATNGSLEISGNTNLIRSLGKSLRYTN